MLSKSQARSFFLGGTLICATAFIALSVDSMRQVPKRTHSQNLSEEVKRGKHLWDKNNCMGCHTLMGEGAYYAPELTKVYERRGQEWMKVFLKDPEAMFPGARKMVNYHLSDGDITDLIAFFKWMGEVDLNGFPAKPNLVVPLPPSVGIAPALSAAPQKFAQICTACHALGGKGGNVGPALDGVGKKWDSAYLDEWLKDPPSKKPGTLMPKLPLTDPERAELVQFLSGLK